MIKSCYVHIPFCKNICSYCDFCKNYYDELVVDTYLDNLKKEINEMSIQLCYYFLNVLISLNDLNIDKSVHINNLPYLILYTLTFKDLSNLFHNTELEDIFAEWIKNGKKHIINANNIFNNLNRK